MPSSSQTPPTPSKESASDDSLGVLTWASGKSVGIMQPYLFPYIGYFQLIAATDRWVAFDTAQFIRHGWVNRNRMLHPSEGAQYIQVPLVKHSRGTSIREVCLADKAASLKRILGQVQHYKKRAPFFAETVELIERTFEGPEMQLTDVIARGLELCCERLAIELDARTFSQMNLALGPVEGPGEWAPRIAEALGATSYVNPPGGEDLFDPAFFESVGVELKILEPDLVPYAQGGRSFEAGLSILDVFMWNSPEEAHSLLANHTVRDPKRS